MKFNCYDVVEIQGKRYVVTEVISYQESIMKSTKRYTLDDEIYNKKLGTLTRAETWTEYGLKPVEGKNKCWLTIVNGEKEYGTLSQNASRSTPPKGYKLHDKGIQHVISVDGDSNARKGDEANYKEYRLTKNDTTYVFFMEAWTGGLKDQSEGERIPLSDLHRRRDQAAQEAGKKVRNARRRKELVTFCLYWFGLLLFFGYLVLGETTWHEVRASFGFPYTMEERMEDSFYYEPNGIQDNFKLYISKQDTNATAIDLIDALYGDIYTIKQDSKSPVQTVVIYTTDEVSVISNVNGTTQVEVLEFKKLSDEQQSRLSNIHNSSEMLLRYANIVDFRKKQGRKSLSTEIKD